jgi:hypothetical protein
MGKAWAAMKSSFKGRSDSELKNRWHRHIKSKTVHDGTKFRYTESDAISPDNHGKESDQRKTCPNEAVLSSVQEEVEPKTSQPLVMNSVPTPRQISRRSRRKLGFTPKEDAVINRVKLADPSESWPVIAKRLPGRTARQCRQRWTRFLAPEISSEPWTREEDRFLVDKINEMGKAWAAMTPSFKGRSDNTLNNRWHRHIKSKTVHDGTKFIYTESDPNCPDNRQGYHKRKICPKEAALAILKEHQLLVEKINEIGTDSVAMAPSFNRSQNAVKDGGFRHLQFETVDGDKIGPKKKKAVFWIPQEKCDSESLFMGSTRESIKTPWDQITTEDEWLPLTPGEPE